MKYKLVRRPSVSSVTTLATAHAPKGGITIKGKKFRPGEFVPDTHLEHATDEQKAKLEMRQDLFDEPAEAIPPETPKPDQHPAAQILNGIIGAVKQANDFPKSEQEKFDLSGKKDNTSLVEKKPEEKKMEPVKIQYRNHKPFIGNFPLWDTNNNLLRETEKTAVNKGINGDDAGYAWFEITPEQAKALIAHTKSEETKFKAWQNRSLKTVKADCGHTCEAKHLMSASLGTSCPDCYDRMSG